LVLFVGLRAGAGGWEIVIKGGPADPEALGNGHPGVTELKKGSGKVP
jgi:hypothetical protein